jgi:hypothetical protein
MSLEGMGLQPGNLSFLVKSFQLSLSPSFYSHSQLPSCSINTFEREEAATLPLRSDYCCTKG